jgi:hypothetical protein
MENFKKLLASNLFVITMILLRCIQLMAIQRCNYFLLDNFHHSKPINVVALNSYKMNRVS